MANWQQIFEKHAVEYDLAIAREDYQKNIPRALNQICSFEGVDVVEFGAGTGRLTCMLAPMVRSIRAFDGSQHMLETAITNLEKLRLRNWLVGVADNRCLPIGNQTADVAIAGWTFCFLLVWEKETWRTEINLALAQMKRVLRPGGTAIIVEALGNDKTPEPPLEELGVYYARLEEEHGFRSTWIRTDTRYESLAEAKKLIRLFQGDESADKVVEEGTLIFPECTGIWWLTV